MDKNLKTLKDRFRAWHDQSSPLDDVLLDRELDLRSVSIEETLDAISLHVRLGSKLLVHEPTPYGIIRAAITELGPTSRDVFYDLGFGYGRVLFYGALVSDASYRGFEIVPARVAEAERVKSCWALTSIHLREGDACLADFTDGNIFFLFNPFFTKELRMVCDKLEMIARRKSIRIASVAGCGDYLASLTWLEERAAPTSSDQELYRLHVLRFFDSI
jgi:SAM-dependent methyltransferase